MKNLFLALLMVAYTVLHWAFAVVAFCLVWKVTQHFWPFMNSVLRLILAVAGGGLVLLLAGSKFTKPKGADEDRTK